MINYYLLVNPKKRPQHIWCGSTWATSAWIKFILILPKFWKHSALYAETSFALALVLMSNFSSCVAKSWCSWLDMGAASVWFDFMSPMTELMIFTRCGKVFIWWVMFPAVCNIQHRHWSQLWTPIIGYEIKCFKRFSIARTWSRFKKNRQFFTHGLKYVAKNTRRCLNVFTFIFSSYPNLTKSSYLP